MQYRRMATTLMHPGVAAPDFFRVRDCPVANLHRPVAVSTDSGGPSILELLHSKTLFAGAGPDGSGGWARRTFTSSGVTSRPELPNEL